MQSWEYPGNRDGSQPDDIIYFTLLIQEMKQAFAPYSLLLSAAVSAGISKIVTGYNISALNT